jgi:hypothetical protein
LGLATRLRLRVTSAPDRISGSTMSDNKFLK